MRTLEEPVFPHRSLVPCHPVPAGTMPAAIASTKLAELIHVLLDLPTRVGNLGKWVLYKLYQVIIPHVPKGVGDQNDQTSRALAA